MPAGGFRKGRTGGSRALRRVTAAALIPLLLFLLLPAPGSWAEGPEYPEAAYLLEWEAPEEEAVLPGESSPYYEDSQWNLDLIGAAAAYDSGFLGQGVRVGVIDSGISPHSAFGDRLLPGHNYIYEAEDPDDTADTYGHGTRVAGIIAGSGEDGYIGAAPGALLVPLKVTDGKSVAIQAICDAIYGGIDDYGCQVLNLSLGTAKDSEKLRAAIEYAEERGVVVFSAVGNGGTSALYYPAAYDTVVGVGAVTRDASLYYGSNRNGSVYLTAPGENVRSTTYTGGYGAGNGTSFAVPHASAAAAVMLGLEETLTPAELRAILADTAADLGDPGYDTSYGYGLLDLAACVASFIHTAAVEAGEGGSASVSPAAGPAGTPVTVEAVPEEGYALERIVWSFEGGPETDITREGCFLLPEENVTVTVTFRQKGPPLLGSISGDTLTYALDEVPEGAVLVAARYDGERLTALDMAAVTQASGVFTLPGGGEVFRLFLVDSLTFAPLGVFWQGGEPPLDPGGEA